MTKVLLVSAIPKDYYYSQSPRRRALGDLGIRYIAAYLNKSGIETDILPAYLYSTNNLIEYLKNKKDIVAIGFSMHTISANKSLEDVKIVKKEFPQIKIWLGGYLATFGAEFLLKTDYPFDYIMRGEGELASLELCSNIIKGNDDFKIKGVVRKNNINFSKNDFAEIPIIDNLNFPFFNKNDKEQCVGEYMISASRGCYGHCTFCSIPAFNPKRRERSVKSVVDEMELLKTSYNATFVDFVDDSFLGRENGEERAKEFSDAINEKKLNINFRISLRANNISDATLTYLKSAGLTAVQLGIESLSPRQLKLYNKGVTAFEALKAVKLLKKYGIYVQCGFILFEPSTTIEDLIINAKFLMRERWAVVKSTTQNLFCAEGTSITEFFKKKGIFNNVIEGYLNYNWKFKNGKVELIRDLILEYESKLQFPSIEIYDAITPPSILTDNRYKVVKDLQNKYQRLSFSVLFWVCKCVIKGFECEKIMNFLAKKFDRKFEKLKGKVENKLKEFHNGQSAAYCKS